MTGSQLGCAALCYILNAAEHTALTAGKGEDPEPPAISRTDLVGSIVRPAHTSRQVLPSLAGRSAQRADCTDQSLIRAT